MTLVLFWEIDTVASLSDVFVARLRTECTHYGTLLSQTHITVADNWYKCRGDVRRHR